MRTVRKGVWGKTSIWRRRTLGTQISSTSLLRYTLEPARLNTLKATLTLYELFSREIDWPVAVSKDDAAAPPDDDGAYEEGQEKEEKGGKDDEEGQEDEKGIIGGVWGIWKGLDWVLSGHEAGEERVGR